MKIYIIFQGYFMHGPYFVSAHMSEEKANEECERLKEEAYPKARERYWVEETDLLE